MKSLDMGTPAKNLHFLVNRLATLDIEAFVVDLTTDEARAVGMKVVRVVVPALQPLTFRVRARYLAHPRLFKAPDRMGYPVHPEDDLNSLPQPFG
jgi:ribosomal protein S12 methylthiotransferase accessory factor